MGSGARESASTELVFVVEDADEGGYTAKALGPSICTEADTMDELLQYRVPEKDRKNVSDRPSIHSRQERDDAASNLVLEHANPLEVTLDAGKALRHLPL